jgi:acetyltransferase-like isoleucine patch superfamily enzyme
MERATSTEIEGRETTHRVIVGNVVTVGEWKCGAFVSIDAGARGKIVLGRSVNLKSGVKLIAYGGEIVLEDRVSIGENTVIYGHGGVHIARASAIGPLCFIGSQEHIKAKELPLRFSGETAAKTTIGEGAIISAGCVVTAGVSVGLRAFVGAGSLVFSDVPDHYLAYGSPCRPVELIERNPLYGWPDQSD